MLSLVGFLENFFVCFKKSADNKVVISNIHLKRLTKNLLSNYKNNIKTPPKKFSLLKYKQHFKTINSSNFQSRLNV